MSIVTTEAKLAEHDEVLMRRFLYALSTGATLTPGSSTRQRRTRTRCKSWGLADYSPLRRAWTITDEGRAWLKNFDARKANG